VWCVLHTALVQMTTMTGLSSIASLSLGLSMSMSSAGQPGLGEKTAKLQSQLSMLHATPPGPSDSNSARPQSNVNPRSSSTSLATQNSAERPRTTTDDVVRDQTTEPRLASVQPTYDYDTALQPTQLADSVTAVISF